MIRFRQQLLFIAAALIVSSTVLTAVAGIASPAHYPAWATRVTSIIFLAVAVIAGSAGIGYWRASRKDQAG